jgi:hypothetical protein
MKRALSKLTVYTSAIGQTIDNPRLKCGQYYCTQAYQRDGKRMLERQVSSTLRAAYRPIQNAESRGLYVKVTIQG